jgi:hypothetical protein
MNSFNGFANSIRNTIYYVINKYVYNFPLIDPSLVFYYPLDSSNVNAMTANYASGLPVYDASMIGLAINTYTLNNFVTGLGDLSLNNTMGSVATSYVQSNTNFNLVPSTGLSISLWFSCSGQMDICGTLISLYQQSIDSSIRVGLYGNTLFSVYGVTPLTYTVSTTGSPTIDTSISGYTQYLFKNTTGTFNITNISKDIDIHIFAVAGGGGGGITSDFRDQAGGGGGGGGVIQVYKTTKSNSLFDIIVGNGGSNTTSQPDFAKSGDNTIVKYNSNDLVTAYGGGGGGDWNTTGKTGGSCSGNPPGRQEMPEITVCTFSTDWSLVFSAGNKGGGGQLNNLAGGGGGAGGVGGDATSTLGGNGGNGITPSVVNTKQVFTSTTYAGGGGGGNKPYNTQSSGGTGGGGKGCSNNNSANKNGTANTGGGGGGGKEDYSGTTFLGGDGGSGICIISIPTSG